MKIRLPLHFAATFPPAFALRLLWHEMQTHRVENCLLKFWQLLIRHRFDDRLKKASKRHDKTVSLSPTRTRRWRSTKFSANLPNVSDVLVLGRNALLLETGLFRTVGCDVPHSRKWRCAEHFVDNEFEFAFPRPRLDAFHAAQKQATELRAPSVNC